MALKQVYRWISKLKKKIGKTDLNDEQPPGAPYTASTDKILASLLQYVYI